MTNNRKYWVIPKEVFSGNMDIRSFLKKAGYSISSENNISGFNGRQYFGRLCSTKTQWVCVDTDSSRLEDLNYLRNLMDFIELLAVNNVPFEERESRKLMERELRKGLAGIIKRFREVPRGSTP